MRTLNVYYLRAHTYTIVPRQIAEDMKWMAEAGTNIVSIAVLEQDFTAAVENIRIICEEAHRHGMRAFAVPSRWAGLVAGAPKVPSLYSCQNPGGWILERDGRPLLSPFSGVISSVHAPDTLRFFSSCIDRLFETWPFDGFILDEPKGFAADYSPAALSVLGATPSLDEFEQSAVDFYERVLQHSKLNHPDKETWMFIHANKRDFLVNACAKIVGLDVYGCDGRPWRIADEGENEEPGKVLLDANQGERFLQAAKQNGKQSLWLIENHNMRRQDYELMDRRLPDLFTHAVDNLIYYYYPRNLENPELAMEIMRNHILRSRENG
jgi:hypothetical protein